MSQRKRDKHFGIQIFLSLYERYPFTSRFFFSHEGSNRLSSCTVQLYITFNILRQTNSLNFLTTKVTNKNFKQFPQCTHALPHYLYTDVLVTQTSQTRSIPHFRKFYNKLVEKFPSKNNHNEFVDQKLSHVILVQKYSVTNKNIFISANVSSKFVRVA